MWITPLCWQRRPATHCTAARWCQSCFLSATASHTSPMVWIPCTVSTTITIKGSSSHHTRESFCPQVTTAHTSCRLLMAGEDQHAQTNDLYTAFTVCSVFLIFITHSSFSSYLVFVRGWMLWIVSVWMWLGVRQRPTCSASCSWNTQVTLLPSHSAAWRSCCMSTATLLWIIMKVQIYPWTCNYAFVFFMGQQLNALDLW